MDEIDNFLLKYNLPKTGLKIEDTNKSITKAIQLVVKKCPTKKTPVTILQGRATKHLRNAVF